MSSKNNIPLLLLEVLKAHSDDNHRLTQKEIKDYLLSDYGVDADRKTIIRNLLNLQDDNFPVKCTEHSRGDADGNEPIRTDWYLEREFSETELMILADMVKRSRLIPQEHSKALLEKIGKLGTGEFASAMKFATGISGGNEDNHLFETLEALSGAIASGCKVRFNSTGHDASGGLNTYPSGKVKDYYVNPYKLIFDNDLYYLLGSTGKLNSFSGYRIDRIVNLETLTDKKSRSYRDIEQQEPSTTLDEFIRLKKYRMPGDTVRVEFKVNKMLLSNIRNWFDEDEIRIVESDDKSATYSVKANKKTILYWGVQYCKYVEIISPQELRDEIRTILENAVRKYRKEAKNEI